MNVAGNDPILTPPVILPYEGRMLILGNNPYHTVHPMGL
jgi:hypothetical protein